MITATDAYKLASTLDSKQVWVTVTDGSDPITESGDLKSVKIMADGGYCKTVMRQAEVCFWGTHDYLNKYLNIQAGISLPTSTSKGEVTISIATPCVVTLATHGLSTGDRVSFSTTDTLPTGLTTTQFYYVIKNNNDSFWVATTYPNAIAGTKVNTTGSQAGTHTLTYYNGTTSANKEYLDYGDFKAIELSEDKANDQQKVKCFDRMYEALQLYELDLSAEYPITVLELVQAICTELGWTLATTSFFNSTFEISEELFTGQGLTYRNVLDMVAEVTATTILFSDDELVLKAAPASLETLETTKIISLDISPRWGELNSLCLSRQPQEDNIVEQDEESIETYGLWEFKMKNNLILDDDRETYITTLFAEMQGLIFYPTEVQTVGLGYFEVGDMITVTDLNDVTYDTFLSSLTLEFAGGFRENLVSATPEQTSTNYNTAGIIGQTIKKTEIIVNKQEGDIQMLVGETTSLHQTDSAIQLTAQTALTNSETNATDIDTAQQDIAELELRADGLDVAVTQLGGTNMLKNSSGLKGTIEEWQVFDENGDLVDVQNDGTCVTTQDVVDNTEANAAIFIDDQYITQSVSTILDETYTFYCRFRKNEAVTVSITGIEDPIDLTITDYVDDTWAVFSYQFTALSENTTITIDATATDADAYVGDMVLKMGSVTGWVQAPNEVYGSNFRFDKDGFSVTSESTHFKSTLDSDSLSVYDTSLGTDKTMMVVSKDEGKITNLTAQDTFSVQRYDNPSKRARFIPTETGLMIVIND